jgi:hypothetical protein
MNRSLDRGPVTGNQTTGRNAFGVGAQHPRNRASLLSIAGSSLVACPLPVVFNGRKTQLRRQRGRLMKFGPQHQSPCGFTHWETPDDPPPIRRTRFGSLPLRKLTSAKTYAATSIWKAARSTPTIWVRHRWPTGPGPHTTPDHLIFCTVCALTYRPAGSRTGQRRRCCRPGSG